MILLGDDGDDWPVHPALFWSPAQQLQCLSDNLSSWSWVWSMHPSKSSLSSSFDDCDKNKMTHEHGQNCHQHHAHWSKWSCHPQAIIMICLAALGGLANTALMLLILIRYFRTFIAIKNSKESSSFSFKRWLMSKLFVSCYFISFCKICCSTAYLGPIMCALGSSGQRLTECRPQCYFMLLYASIMIPIFSAMIFLAIFKF